jgi:predicted PurR-regulated permease PerM
MNEKITLKKVNNFLLCGILICLILYFAKTVLIPIAFGVFFAMLFTSLSNRLERAGVKRIFTTLISMLILLIVISGIVTLVYLQAKNLADDGPKIEQKSKEFLTQAQTYISSELDITEEKQNALIKKQLDSGAGEFGKVLKGFLSGIVGFAGSAVIVLIFTFLFLYQREKYESFFIQAFKNTPPEKAKDIISKISKVSQKYLVGRALSILIFTTLFTTGFLIIGLKNAFLLAFVAALLTIVPYVGSIVGGLFPFAVALVTEDDTQVAFGALAVIAVVQAIDNYFIEPYIIGGEVNISGFFTILILLVGGMLWGVAGMILFLPLLAVVKIIFDSIPGLSHYGYLIGDQQTENQSKRLLEKIKKIVKK